MTSPVTTDVAIAKQPRTQKVKHVGTVDGMPGSRVTFTLVKQGRKLGKVVNVQVTGFRLFCTHGNGAGEYWFTEGRSRGRGEPAVVTMTKDTRHHARAALVEIERTAGLRAEVRGVDRARRTVNPVERAAEIADWQWSAGAVA